MVKDSAQGVDEANKDKRHRGGSELQQLAILCSGVSEYHPGVYSDGQCGGELDHKQDQCDFGESIPKVSGAGIRISDLGASKDGQHYRSNGHELEQTCGSGEKSVLSSALVDAVDESSQCAQERGGSHGGGDE